MQTKTVYSYSKDTHEYNGTTIAFESPLEPGVFHVPACAAETAPPEAETGQAIVFDADAQEWVIKVDNRGVKYYDTETQEIHTITEIGAEPPEGWTYEEPTDPGAVWTGVEWEVPFEVLKERKRAEIAAARYVSACGTLEIDGKPYHIDSDARTAFLGTLAAFQTGALTETVWKLADGTFTTLDEKAFVLVATSVLAYIEQCFTREKALIALVDAATTAKDLVDIIW